MPSATVRNGSAITNPRCTRPSRLRKLLGDNEGSAFDAFPARPKRMRVATYQHLEARYLKLLKQAIGGALLRFLR